MGEKVSAAPERLRGGGRIVSSCSSSSGSSSGSSTLSEEGDAGLARDRPGGCSDAGRQAAAPRGAEREEAGRWRQSEEAASPGGGQQQQLRPESDASLEEQEEELDHILSPPSMLFRKSSNPEVSSGPGKSFKFKRQLSEDGRPFRRGSLGGALTGRYLLPNTIAQQSWQPAETSNLVRMRSQALGQSAPSLTASLKELSLPRRGSFGRWNEG